MGEWFLVLQPPRFRESGAEKYLNWYCESLQQSQWNCMSIDLVFCGLMV